SLPNQFKISAKNKNSCDLLTSTVETLEWFQSGSRSLVVTTMWAHTPKARNGRLSNENLELVGWSTAVSRTNTKVFRCTAPPKKSLIGNCALEFIENSARSITVRRMIPNTSKSGVKWMILHQCS